MAVKKKKKKATWTPSTTFNKVGGGSTLGGQINQPETLTPAAPKPPTLADYQAMHIAKYGSLAGFIGPGGTSAAPTAQTAPPDSIYTQQMGLIEKNKGNIYAEYGNPFAPAGSDFTTQFGYQGGVLASDYGYTPGTMNIDPNNPFSRAMLLQRSYQQGQRGTVNSMASAGQLYSGANQRNLQEGTFKYGRDSDALAKGYTAGLHSLTQHASEALSQLDQQGIDADADRLGRVPDPEPAAETVSDSGGASGATAGANPLADIAKALGPSFGQGNAKLDQTLIKAFQMWHSGNKSGKDWRPILDALGYDPRKSNGKLIFKKG